jgi:hypothetical protein
MLRHTSTSRAAAVSCALLLAITAIVSRAQTPSTPAPTQTAAASQARRGVISGAVGPSPYDVVSLWQQPFAEPGFAFGGNSGVFAESADRILIAMRGETRLPNPLPPSYRGFAGSIGINVLTKTDLRVWRNCLYSVDRNGRVKERWPQWDSLCDGSQGPGPHRLRINPYDPERRVWLVQESFHQIFVLSNDGSKLLKTYGEKNVAGADRTHFAKPQDVAFLGDGRVLIADGLDNHRVVILDRDGTYLGEFGGRGNGPGQFNGVHAVAVGPGGRIFALDRSGGRINVFKTTPEQGKVEFVDAWEGFALPLDIIVNDDAVWVADLTPLRFTKLDFSGRHLYTWMVPPDLPDGHLEVHAFSVDSEHNLFAGDNQYGRTQKFSPSRDADPALIIKPPWRGK